MRNETTKEFSLMGQSHRAARDCLSYSGRGDATLNEILRELALAVTPSYEALGSTEPKD